MKTIILASGSPRRRELLSMLGFDFDVEVSEVEEVIRPGLTNTAIVKDLAYQKAKAVFEKHKDCIVIGSDTIVECDDKIMGKPHSQQEAKEMMQTLRNRSHKVITGVAILSDKQQDFFADVAEVIFNNIADSEIEEYIQSKEPYDKAGAYAIQGWAGRYIREIKGNYYTIMGLPIDKVFNILKQYKGM